MLKNLTRPPTTPLPTLDPFSKSCSHIFIKLLSAPRHRGAASLIYQAPHMQPSALLQTLQQKELAAFKALEEKD